MPWLLRSFGGFLPDMEITSYLYILPAAFLLDFILGDPLFLPHPVRWIGKWIEKWEPYFRKLPFSMFISGCLFAVSLIFGTYLITWGILIASNAIHPSICVIMQIVLIYYSLSAKSLRMAAMDIYRSLKDNNLSDAGIKASQIVGRDIESLDEQGVTRGTIESVAENLVDGVISPLFFALLGGAPMALAYKMINTLDGAPMALAYKMINTLDSMIGYKDERYEEFGKCAAHIDDAANFLPARISVLIISLAAITSRGGSKGALLAGFREGGNNPSPNSGFPEAAFAGALVVRLGGPNYYKGNLVKKPYIGASFGETIVDDIRKACNLMVVSALLWMITCWWIKIIFWFLFLML
jgi:adenosylcobinamide-phosphate synthase